MVMEEKVGDEDEDDDETQFRRRIYRVAQSKKPLVLMMFGAVRPSLSDS